MSIIEARGVKKDQAVAFELRTIRNGVDEYRQRMFGARGCVVPDFCDGFTQSNVNELSRNSATLNDWVIVAFQPGSPCFFQLRLDL